MSPGDPPDAERPHARPDLSYGDYLKLDRLLAAQMPLSAEHDELLFIIIHQTSELWMQLSLHELGAARDQVRRDELGPAFKMIARVSRIQAQLIQSWDVLATMTPSDYEAIRPSLGQSSGFQSYQYRELEFILGAKTAANLTVHEPDAAIHARLLAAFRAPSLYDEALRLLDRRGLRLPASCVERDWTLPYVPNPAVEAAWLEVYRDPQRWWDLYELAEKLVDLEFRFQQWRFAHMKTVERIIGFKAGTGGSSGVAYLSRALDQSFFPELFSLRTRL
ncbi:MAG TPA: tryptophan 2,3-dioxygenase [Phenylobacterium sp.]|jgi:tryptophan 2,3-dioxygenase|nr:tryptophan 2,3-dioxygenase [Phenylobacterium sp.]